MAVHIKRYFIKHQQVAELFGKIIDPDKHIPPGICFADSHPELL
jgi:hypothetical protein